MKCQPMSSLCAIKRGTYRGIIVEGISKNGERERINHEKIT
ncbi:MAG: hypothetical protein K0S39_4031 [Paenibacillus sp.]|nr:hypothetical protein [Paenibacillus sp.]